MTTLLFIFLCVVVLAMHYRPDYFNNFLHIIKTTYLKPEVSIFELLLIGLILVLGYLTI